MHHEQDESERQNNPEFPKALSKEVFQRRESSFCGLVKRKKQRMDINAKFSCWKEVVNEVLQGSVLNFVLCI